MDRNETKRFADNPAYQRYEYILLCVHDLIANEVRADADIMTATLEEFEELMPHLSAEELDRLNRLSGDLYQLVGREVFAPVQPGDDASALNRAHDAQDWPRCLELLSRGVIAEDEYRALYRAGCYSKLGHAAIAERFKNYYERVFQARVTPS